jgi:hypothetical protein
LDFFCNLRPAPEYSYLYIFLSGARLALEAMMGWLQPIIGSRFYFFELSELAMFPFDQIMMSLLMKMTIFSSVFTIYGVFDVSDVHHHVLHV